MSSRSERLLAALDGAAVDVLLVSDLTCVRYLTGYTGSNGLALLGGGETDIHAFVTDFRYVEQAAEEVGADFERVRAPQDLVEAIPELLPSGSGTLRLGFDDAHTSVRQHKRLRSLLPERVELVPAGGLVEELRRIKEPEEVERIAAAARIADDALEAVLAGGLAGRTERELALQLEMAMRERGAEAVSFDSIVAAGPHGALPHASPREVAVTPGELVVFDWGAVFDGYHSDCTRTVAVGEIDAEAREAYELVLAAQLAGLQAVRAGAGGQEADRAARTVIEQAGHGEHYGHGLGHGVGLEIHEAPRLSQRSEDRLVSGNVVTVEPGVYLPERFGIRIEDLVVVTEDGCRILTGIAKGLRVVD